MKRFSVLLAALAACAAVGAGGAAIAAAAGQPEIDRANANIQVAPSKVAVTKCLGEDGIPYETFTSSWKGGEAENVPGSTDYNLSGTFTVSKLVWTINMATQRGVLTGTATLKSPPPGGTATQTTYSGPLRLITQGIPDSAGAYVPARGWIDANTYTGNVKDGGSLLANVEFQIAPSLAAHGQFGDLNPSLNIPDYSVVTNNQVC
jgi:hypothetical protein